MIKIRGVQQCLCFAVGIYRGPIQSPTKDALLTTSPYHDVIMFYMIMDMTISFCTLWQLLHICDFLYIELHAVCDWYMPNTFQLSTV